MDDLTLAAEKIDAVLDALATAAARHPSLREDFERRAVRLLELRDELDATHASPKRTGPAVCLPWRRQHDD